MVSVLICTYNSAKVLPGCLRSLAQQDYRPLEIIVMDGGSRDETVSVLESYSAPELHWSSEPDRGVVARSWAMIRAAPR